MAELKEFDVVRVARSDGSDTGPGYWPVTAPALKKSAKDIGEKAPRAKPQMIRLADDDPRFTDWKVKLGIILKMELSPNPDEGNAWFVEFPRGYWLYEKSKHIWVSGYPVKAKLFKTPQEFAAHLIWLLSSSKEYKDCCCVHCSSPNMARLAASMDETTSNTPILHPVKPDKATSRVTPVPLPTLPGQATGKQAEIAPRVQPGQNKADVDAMVQMQVQAQARAQAAVAANALQQQQTQQVQKQQEAQQVQQQQQQQQQQQAQQQQAQQQQAQQQQAQQQQAQQQQAQQQQAQQQQAQPPNQQQTQQTEQKETQQQAKRNTRWTLKSSILFRIGEQVWFQNGSTWRLGIIAKQNQKQPGLHELLPIGSGLIRQQHVTKQDKDLRPFQAFSVPPVTIPELSDKIFDEVPWEAKFREFGNDAAKRDLLLLDASKLAASKVDWSSSLWSLFSDSAATEQKAYFGCFLGAERIELGDCLRIRNVPAELNVASEDSVVFGLRSIFAHVDSPGAIIFRGTLYQRAEVGLDRSLHASADQLPIALRDELLWRTKVQPGSLHGWVIVAETVVLPEKAIRGRFYPIHRIMPILNPAGFEAAIGRGQIDGQQPYLNSRMEGVGRYLRQQRNRVETFGASVPAGARFSFEPYVLE